jgi:hypothetical protein
MAIKPISADATVDVIYSGDEAIDIEASDLAAYDVQRTKAPGCWRELVRAKDGERITRFTVGVIPSGKLCAIEDATQDHLRERFWRCFLEGLVDIKDGPEVKRDRSGKIDRQWLEQVFVGVNRAVALDVGAQAWLWQQFGEDDARP